MFKRMTDELGIENIEYRQDDILNLSQDELGFDIIESVGVLHHMAQPMEGLRRLTELIKKVD